MKISQALTFVSLATLAFAGRSSICAADVTPASVSTPVSTSVSTSASTRANAAATISASALHTGVHPRAHHHRLHVRRARRSELRAAPAHAPAPTTIPSPVPTMPKRRPAGSRAALPHVTNKPPRSQPRGGAPYALGPASPSLGQGLDRVPMPTQHNELVSNPSLGLLRGRSPPRGDPLSATSLPRSRATLPTSRAPRNPIHIVSEPASLRRFASGHAGNSPEAATDSLGPFVFHRSPSHVTPPTVPSRAGRPGSHLPLWRCFT
jgi:hypothetical protein